MRLLLGKDQMSPWVHRTLGDSKEMSDSVPPARGVQPSERPDVPQLPMEDNQVVYFNAKLCLASKNYQQKLREGSQPQPSWEGFPENTGLELT